MGKTHLGPGQCGGSLETGLSPTNPASDPTPWPQATFPTSVVVGTLQTSRLWQGLNVEPAGAGIGGGAGRQGAEAAPVSPGTTVPLAATKNGFPGGCGQAM